ncbi:MAG: class II aldolase/adducin family protein [Gemmatimonadota bacterium]
MNESSLRQELLGVCEWLARSGFTPGTTGNASARLGGDGTMLITPGGVPYADVGAEDLVPVDSAAGPAADSRPSSEWRLHAAIYRARPDARAVVHAHPRAATALACLRRPIPAFHYMVASAGGSAIPCAAYATFGTDELADSVVRTLGAYLRACLMANHGLVALGAGPAAALALARDVEALADQYLGALAAGRPALLADEEMERVAKQLAAYGYRSVQSRIG